MISLVFALLAGSVAADGQAIQATLQGCSVENGRQVCRYAVPDVVIVPVEGSNIVADAPAVVLGANGGAPSAEAAPPPTTTVTEPPAPPVAPPTAPTTVAPTTTTVVDPGPIQPIDTGVLTERESQLVARCADAGWVSLCLPDDRRAARTLRDKQTAYLAVRREVTRLLGEERCEAAARTALDGGYLALAREARDYCAPPATTASTGAAAALSAAEPEAEPKTDEVKVEAEAGADQG